jgi:hypothetical protein
MLQVMVNHYLGPKFLAEQSFAAISFLGVFIQTQFDQAWIAI